MHDTHLLSLGTPSRSLTDLNALEAEVLNAGFASFTLPCAVDDIPQHLGEVMTSLYGALAEYTEAATPRHRVGKDFVYTSTDYPAHEVIPLHNEGAYSSRFPLRLGFACVRPGAGGGHTTLADGAAVWDRLSEPTQTMFLQRGVEYVRTFHSGLGPKWQDVLGVDTREEVDHACASRGQTHSWVGDVLQTRRCLPAVIEEPASGRRVWFNQVAAFHPCSLPKDLRMALEAEFGPALLPKTVNFGDSEPIPDSVVHEIQLAYSDVASHVRWKAGACVIVNNLRLAHGRTPHRGDRKIVVAMAGLSDWPGVGQHWDTFREV